MQIKDPLEISVVVVQPASPPDPQGVFGRDRDRSRYQREILHCPMVVQAVPKEVQVLLIGVLLGHPIILPKQVVL